MILLIDPSMEPQDLIYLLLHPMMIDFYINKVSMGTFDDNIGPVSPDDCSRANVDLWES